MSRPALGVAIVGASPGHWSATAHLPAIAAIEDLQARWLVTSTPETADAASAEWGVPATHELARVLDDTTVDVVTVTLRVPRHAEVVAAAVAAGKHVYCEWPLAVDSAEAARLVALAQGSPGRVHVAGLQGRFSPELRTAAHLLGEGRIGRPLTASLRLFLSHGLTPRPAHRAHLRHAAVAANVLTIQAGHTLDMLGVVLGRGTVSAARLWSAVPEFIVDTGERLARDAPDNLAAWLDYGDVLAVTQFSQTAAAESFALEVLGPAGVLRLTGSGQPQFGGLSLALAPLGEPARTVPAIPTLPFASPLPADHAGVNVAAAYAALVAAARTGTVDPLLPTFETALDQHRLLDEVAARALTAH